MLAPRETQAETAADTHTQTRRDKRDGSDGSSGDQRAVPLRLAIGRTPARTEPLPARAGGGGESGGERKRGGGEKRNHGEHFRGRDRRTEPPGPPARAAPLACESRPGRRGEGGKRTPKVKGKPPVKEKRQRKGCKRQPKVGLRLECQRNTSVGKIRPRPGSAASSGPLQVATRRPSLGLRRRARPSRP